LNNHKIVNLANPTIGTDALNQQTADNRYYSNSTTLNNITLASGDLSLNNHKITNLSNATSATDALNQ